VEITPEKEHRLVYRRSGYQDMELLLLADGHVANPPGHAEITWGIEPDGTLRFLDAQQRVTAELAPSGKRYRGMLLGGIYVELFEPVCLETPPRSPGPMRYMLGIPYVNRYDLLLKAIASVECFHDHLVLIDNSEARELEETDLNREFEIVHPSVPLTFTQTQNLLQKIAQQRKCDVLFFMHNDAEAAPGSAETFLQRVAELWRTNPRFGVAFTHYDALCAFNVIALGRIGPWDTVFTQYFADNDYYRRLEEAGFEKIDTGIEVYHHGPSATTLSDPHRQHVNNIFFPTFEQYFRSKHP